MSTGDTGAGTGVTFEEMLAPGRDGDTMVGEKTAADLEAVFDVPVRISVVLGRTRRSMSGRICKAGLLPRRALRRGRTRPYKRAHTAAMSQGSRRPGKV